MENMNLVIEKYLAEHENELFEDLRYLVSFPSVISAPEEGAPFGRECRRCLEAAAGLFERDGFEAEIAADGSYALAYYGIQTRSYSVRLHRFKRRDGYEGCQKLQEE